jgi:hypothetical protein
LSLKRGEHGILDQEIGDGEPSCTTQTGQLQKFHFPGRLNSCMSAAFREDLFAFTPGRGLFGLGM